MTAQEKLFEFFYILLQKRKVTASEIAEHFEVTTRTVYRWCDSLTMAGIPVITIQGKGGGIGLTENYRFESAVFSEEERNAIASGVLALASLAEDKNDSYRNAADKIKSLATNASDWVKIDFAPWNDPEKERKNLFEELKKAIFSRTMVNFNYYGLGGRYTSRTVCPWKIIFRGQAWYLFCWCTEREAPRFFKLSRIKNLFLTKTKNTVNYSDKYEKIEKSEYDDLKDITYMKVRAEVSNHAMPVIMDEISGIEIVKTEKDFSLVDFFFPDVDWAPSFFLHFGHAIKILEPQGLIKKISTEAKKVMNLYG